MINDIKLDNISTVPSPKKAQLTEPQKPAATATVEGITISTGLSRHISSIMAENNPTDEHSRVMEMKNRIESNNYSIDTDKLAKKIFQDVFGKNIG